MLNDGSGRERSVTKVTVDKDDERTFAERDKEFIEEYNKKLHEQRLREMKLFRHYEWRGNKLPPFNIEPMPHERQRLSGAGMTAEDRALRRQWLKDQELAPNEPLFIAEYYPRNPFRRAYSVPWNILFDNLKPVLGATLAAKSRFWMPKFAAALCGAWLVTYYFKYHLQNWEDRHGWTVSQSKPVLLNGEMPPSKEANDFYDQGFKSRTALLDLKTSTPTVN